MTDLPDVRDFIPTTVAEAAELAERLVAAGATDAQANGVVGALIRLGAGSEPGAHRVSVWRYRQLLALLVDEPGPGSDRRRRAGRVSRAIPGLLNRPGQRPVSRLPERREWAEGIADQPHLEGMAA